MSDVKKPKIAFYWCASCGGCEEAVVDLGMTLLDVAEKIEIVLWPVALDFKKHHIEALDDGAITASLINGAIRTDEQLEMVELLRRKSQVVIAFGSCATDGGIPGLANLTTKGEIFRTSYLDSPTNVNPLGLVPRIDAAPEGLDAPLPGFWREVCALHQVIEVDYFIPGCAPTPEIIAKAITALLEGALPERGSWLAPSRALCDGCPRRQSRDPNLSLDHVYLPHQLEADPEVCLLEQGIICCGPATRSGCGELCIRANMPCTGCFGAPPGVRDQSAKMLSSIASLFSGKSRAEAEAIVSEILDPAGTFSRYSVATSTLRKKRG